MYPYPKYLTNYSHHFNYFQLFASCRNSRVDPCPWPLFVKERPESEPFNHVPTLKEGVLPYIEVNGYTSSFFSAFLLYKETQLIYFLLDSLQE